MHIDGSVQAVMVYNKIAPLYAKIFHTPSDHICDFLKVMKHKGKVLDIGCGHGINANYMTSKGFDVTGVDLSDKMIKIAKERFPNIDFNLADMRNLNFDPEFFDGLFVSFSIIHLPKKDVSSTLRLFNRLLRKNGVMYISAQLGKSEEVYVDSPLKPDEKIFLNVFSEEELLLLIQQTGFHISITYSRQAKNPELDFRKFFILAGK